MSLVSPLGAYSAASAAQFPLTKSCAVYTLPLIVILSAAVAPIPITGAVVVFIITVLVAFPFFIPALTLNLFNTGITFVFELAVLAFAGFAKIVVVGSTTTIAPIPVAPTVVVPVVTHLVAFILWLFTCLCTWATRSFVFGIFAQAFLAV